MKKEYLVIKTDTGSVESGKAWKLAPCAHVDVAPWGSDYRPYTYGQVVSTDTDYWVHLVSVEKEANMRAVATGIHPEVWLDSAMEFFFAPCAPTDARYFNMEFNSRGAMYLGIGHNRHDNVLLKDADITRFEIKNTVEPTTEPGMVRWTVTARIPFSFLAEFFGEQDYANFVEMNANFYKCGANTPEPHCLCWSPIDPEIIKEPDFHRPEFLGFLRPGK